MIILWTFEGYKNFQGYGTFGMAKVASFWFLTRFRFQLRRRHRKHLSLQLGLNWTGIPGDCIIYCISSSKSTFIWVMHGYSSAPPCAPWSGTSFILLMITRCTAEGSYWGQGQRRHTHTMQTVDFNFICIFLYKSKLVSIKTVLTTVCCCCFCCCCCCLYRAYVYVMPHGAAADWCKLLYINFSDRSFWMCWECVVGKLLLAASLRLFLCIHRWSTPSAQCEYFTAHLLLNYINYIPCLQGKSGWTGGLCCANKIEYYYFIKFLNIFAQFQTVYLTFSSDTDAVLLLQRYSALFYRWWYRQSYR